jgi:hypothetical protein
MACAPFIVNASYDVYGFWYVSEYHDESAICWLEVSNVDRLGFPLWCEFVIPILVCCLGFASVIVVYLQFSSGLSKTYLPQLRLFAGNSMNVIVATAFWGIFFIFYSWTFLSRHDDTSFNGDLFNILVFVLSSKGYANFVIWLFIVEFSASSSSTTAAGDAEAISADSNKELRDEILSLITAGIRSTTREGPLLTENTSFTARRLIEKSPNKRDNMSVLLFFKFLSGENESVNNVEENVFDGRGSQVLPEYRLSQISSKSPSISFPPDAKDAIELIRKSDLLRPVDDSVLSSRTISGQSTSFVEKTRSWLSSVLLLDHV